MTKHKFVLDLGAVNLVSQDMLDAFKLDTDTAKALTAAATKKVEDDLTEMLITGVVPPSKRGFTDLSTLGAKLGLTFDELNWAVQNLQQSLSTTSSLPSFKPLPSFQLPEQTPRDILYYVQHSTAPDARIMRRLLIAAIERSEDECLTMLDDTARSADDKDLQINTARDDEGRTVYVLTTKEK